MNVRGVIFAVIDFGKFLRLGPAGEGPEPSCLVFEHEGRRLGLLISKLHGVFDVEDGPPDTPREMFEALGAQRFAVAVSTYAGQPLWHLDVGRIVADVYP